MTITTPQFYLAVKEGKIHLRVKDGSLLTVSTDGSSSKPVHVPTESKFVPRAKVSQSDAPLPLEGYEMLKTGDEIKVDDQIFNEGLGGWTLAFGMVGCKVGQCGWTHGCRKIDKSKPREGFAIYKRGIIRSGDYVRERQYLDWEPARDLIGKRIEDYPEWKACRPK